MNATSVKKRSCSIPGISNTQTCDRVRPVRRPTSLSRILFKKVLVSRRPFMYISAFSIMGKLYCGKCSGPFIGFIDDFKIRNINLEFFGNRFNFGFVTNQDGIGDAAVLGGSYCFKNCAVLRDSNGNWSSGRILLLWNSVRQNLYSFVHTSFNRIEFV